MQTLKLALFWCAALFAMPVALADGKVDCSTAPHWHSYNHYKHGDRVWHHEDSGGAALYSCDKDACTGAGATEPGTGYTWKRVGVCETTPSDD